MEEKTKRKVREILDGYLDAKGHRKTPERYAILDAVYSMDGHFSLEELGMVLEKDNFRVSRATLYNTLKLFLELRLVTRHRFQEGTKYEACYDQNNHCHQICTVCGRVTEFFSTEINQTIQDTRLKRFRKDGFTLYIYGVCTSCQAKMTKKLKKVKETKY